MSGSRIPRRGCRQARRRTVGSGRTCPPGTTIWYGGLIQTIERSRILSLLPAAARTCSATRRPCPGTGIRRPGLPAYPVTCYVSDLTTRRLGRSPKPRRAGLTGGGRSTPSRSQARASIDLLPEGASTKPSSSGSRPTSRTARRSAWGAGEREPQSVGFWSERQRWRYSCRGSRGCQSARRRRRASNHGGRRRLLEAVWHLRCG